MNGLRLLSRNVQQVARTTTQVRGFQTSSLWMTGKAHDANDQTFSSLIGVKEPVIVDFHADWCGPCKTIDPVIREAVASAGDVTLIRVNVDDCPKVSQEYQISSIPFVVALKDGKVVDKFVGAIPRPSIINFVKKHSSLA